MPRRTQAKAPKDTNAPKRPLSSYMLFNKQRMPILRSEQPDKKITELTKVVGAEWRALTAEQKQPFALEAKEIKDKFNLKMAEYKKSDNFSQFEARLKAWKISQKDNATNQTNVDDEDDRPAVRAKAQKRPKDPNAPKKPMTGFFVFQSRRRPQLKEANPDTKHTELVKMASEEWKVMTAEEKEPFEAQSRVKKAEYTEAMKAYKESEEYAKYQAVLAAWKAGKANAAKKPVKPPSPVRAPAKPSSESESYSDSSESPPRSPRGHGSVTSSEESNDSSDVDMGERNNGSSHKVPNRNRDESDSDDESD